MLVSQGTVNMCSARMADFNIVLRSDNPLYDGERPLPRDISFYAQVIERFLSS